MGFRGRLPLCRYLIGGRIYNSSVRLHHKSSNEVASQGNAHGNVLHVQVRSPCIHPYCAIAAQALIGGCYDKCDVHSLMALEVASRPESAEKESESSGETGLNISYISFLLHHNYATRK